MNATEPRFQYIPLEMEMSTLLIANAKGSADFRNLIAKIIVISVLPFLLISAFEALIINGSRLLANGGIVALNAIFDLCPEKAPPLPLPAPPPEFELITREQEVEMPPIALKDDRDDIAYVIETVGTEGVLKLYLLVGKLTAIRDRTTPRVHPFQFLELIFGRGSNLAKHMPVILNTIRKTQFVNDVESSFAVKKHQEKLWEYLPSFAKKVGLSRKKVVSYLYPQQNIEGLLRELTSIHS